jgi:hypothetical protein
MVEKTFESVLPKSETAESIVYEISRVALGVTFQLMLGAMVVFFVLSLVSKFSV